MGVPIIAECHKQLKNKAVWFNAVFNKNRLGSNSAPLIKLDVAKMRPIAMLDYIQIGFQPAVNALFLCLAILDNFGKLAV